LRSVVRGLGSALPRRAVTNAELTGMVATSDEWITQRTGIRQRHIAGEGETTVSLGTLAAERAIADAGLQATDIDLIVLATATPDHTFPSSATEVQARLGIHDKFLVSGSHRRALVIGAETFSRILDWTDRGTCVLFGDGAGALVLEATPATGTNADRGVLTSHLRSDGSHRDKLMVDGGPSTTRTVGHLRMEGREVFRHAVGMITDVIEATFAASGYGGADIDWFVPHQANKRIIDASAQKLGIAAEKVIITVDRHGNTSGASIPLALDVARGDGRIKPGDLVLLEAMGGGFTWAAALLRW
jgi:3-oxoacyl-[acyl-carrier-protein] synthase-3